jgi:hypothetical protein
VVSRIDHRLRIESAPGDVERKTNEAMSSHSPLLGYDIGLLRRRLLKPDLDAFVAEMNNALAEAALLVPQKFLSAILGLTEAMDGAENRDSEWQARWDAARTECFLQCRELLGSGVARAATPDAAPAVPA